MCTVQGERSERPRILLGMQFTIRIEAPYLAMELPKKASENREEQLS